MHINYIRAITALTIVCVLQSNARAQYQDQTLAELLKGLSTPSAIQSSMKTLASPDASASEKAKAEKALAIVRDRVPKLRDLLQKGHSIFEYPGLLTVGPVFYIPGQRGDPGHYYLMIGAVLDSDEFKRPPLLYVSFNEKGIIFGVHTPERIPVQVRER